MTSASVTRAMDQSADQVWRLVEDFADCSWMPAGTEVVVEGEGVGMVRVINGAIREKLEACDPASRTLSYSIADEGVPFPCTGYYATMTVEEGGAGASLTWSCEATPKPGTTDAELTAAVEGLYGVMLGWISDKLKSA